MFLNQCGIYKKSDARKIPTNANDRVQKNLEEGRRIKFGNIGKGGSGKFEFASSNEMWRATIDILDFVPLNNVDYGGGIVITDWYSEQNEDNSAIKIMVQFLSNDVRADGIKITVYNKTCKIKNGSNNCSTNINDSGIGQELKLAILKKASKLKNESDTKEAKEYKKKTKGRVDANTLGKGEGSIK
tara:strand:+ start:244 stop:801 length:558 start_codon:yes stop_codon:yes gene_type:complete